MSQTTKRWSPEAIIQRATDLGIEVLLADGHIQLNAAPGVINGKISSVIREYKQEIIEHLRSQSYNKLLASATSCSVCGVNMELLDDNGSEDQPGNDLQFYYDANGICYCEEHWKGPLPETQQRDQGGRVVPVRKFSPQEVMARARLIAEVWPGGIREISEVEPRITLKEYQVRQRAPKIFYATSLID